MTYRMIGRLFTSKNLIRAAFTAVGLASIGVAHSATTPYHAPVQNYYQNNWMAD